ncbi:hypothetical protein [Kribbella sp. CA-293567]|uniref:hypothetical protein n=1 Tax=Kribbella sp. CA-293567 TaxID=3002436 RepID=UPI0022DE8C99|nr:hypothetical protein [Kribbella sp. CA-293567]WBQ07358.1 hypothetical protein OX958_11270 [Kribbella sp. CA-293567]
MGAVTAGGDHRFQGVTAGKPPTASAAMVRPKDLYPDGAARLPSSLGFEPVVPAGVQRTGMVALGPRMYYTSYTTDGNGDVVPGSDSLTLIGGGWTQYHRYFERSTYSDSSFLRQNTYALVGDVIARWTVGKDGWRYYTTFPGFTSVKAMTLISQTRTYDTFLATTNGGALYTIRVSTGATAPVVKKVRASTWQAFDALIAERCGSQGTLLLGIDQDTKTGYLYAVGHGNGAATVIQGLGKVPATFAESNYFRYFLHTPEAGQLFGE